MKSKQKYGIRGGGKRITKKVKSYLEGYFLAGNVNKTDRMTAKEMVSQLQILANEGEIQVENIPEVATVANWITRYAANLKKLSARRIEEPDSTRNLRNSLTVIDTGEGEEVSGIEIVSQVMVPNKESSVREGGKKLLDNTDNIEHSVKRQKK